MHHTQLLNRLVREGKLTPVAEGAGAAKRSITYHDPCFLGRHNQVYSPPRELLQVLPGAEYVEMERSQERSFCCGAGGARMWMEERIGERINENRTREAVGTGADQIAVGCPFCRVMLDDGLTAAQSRGEAREEVEVLDVAQMLLASVKGVSATKAAIVAGAAPGPAAPPAAGESEASPTGTTADEVPATVPDDAGSLFDTPAPVEDKPAEPADGSLFDDASSLFDTPAPAEEAKAEEPQASGSLFDEGTSLFDTPAATEQKPSEPEPAKPGLSGRLPDDVSLFDVGDPTPSAAPDPVALSQAATAAASDDPDTILDADDEPEAEPSPARCPTPPPSRPTARSTTRRPCSTCDPNPLTCGNIG